jgi:hypothetical protein
VNAKALLFAQKHVQRPRPTLPLEWKSSHEVLAAAVGVEEQPYRGGSPKPTIEVPAG